MWHHSSIIKLIDENHQENPVSIIREKAKETVLQGIDEGWSGPPFDPIGLVKILGFEIRPNEAIKEARIIPKGDSYKIEYNPIQNNRRINFSIAHELAHTFFPDCSDSIRNRENKDRSNWELEFLCDVGAAELLLPYGKFAEDANKVDLELDSLLYLSDIYSASLESVFLRFCEVVEKPCAIIVASFNNEGEKSLEINYSKSSRSFDIKLEESIVIPDNSIVYESKKPGWTAHDIENWDSLGGAFTVYSIGLARVKNDTRSRVGILLVPEEVQEKEVKEIYEVIGDATEPRGSGNKIIAQVVNTSAAVGFGFGRAMAKKWSKTKKDLKKWKKDIQEFQLGNNQLLKVDDDIFVCQILAQAGIRKKTGTPLSYKSLRKGLVDLREYAFKLSADVHMPRIGAGQAGGDWEVIAGIIYEELVQYGIGVTVYQLPGSNKKKMFNKNRELDLFK